mmetsp:Transcript_25550/g.35249  ORF Transcript_25550/g.35249 Transcript_25550/m.35249 type:complete len:205 (-) Transcript_25550:515-1129(-)
MFSEVMEDMIFLLSASVFFSTAFRVSSGLMTMSAWRCFSCTSFLQSFSAFLDALHCSLASSNRNHAAFFLKSSSMAMSLFFSLIRSASRSSALFSCCILSSSLSCSLTLVASPRISWRLVTSEECILNRCASPMAFSVSSSRSWGFSWEKATTRSCGRNWHKLSSCTLSFLVSSRTAATFAFWPLMFHSDKLFLLIFREITSGL